MTTDFDECFVTYSRPLNNKTFETWFEGVERVILHQRRLWQRDLGDVPLSAHQLQELEEMRNLMLNHSASVSGRTLWLGGSDTSRRRETSQFNCLGGETLVLTREHGSVPIRSVVGPVHVVNSMGQWVPAEIASFGQQELIGLRFGFNSHSFTLRATSNHNWKLENGPRLPTKLLNYGDKVPFVLPPREIADEVDHRRGVQHGLVYGDGSKNSYDGYALRLYSAAADLLPFFSEFKHSYPPSCKGAPHIGIPKLRAWCDLKALPAERASDSYLIGFFRGWFAADGSISKVGQATICGGQLEEAWLRQVMSRFGYFVTGSHALPAETNYGTRKKASRTIGIAKACITPDDMLVVAKRERVNQTKMTFGFYGPDQSVAPSTEEVFCAVVPGTHDFVLGNGMLTGNCSERAASSDC